MTASRAAPRRRARFLREVSDTVTEVAMSAASAFVLYQTLAARILNESGQLGVTLVVFQSTRMGKPELRVSSAYNLLRRWVKGPPSPGPIVRPSNSITGVSSPIVPVQNSSSAR